jgi:hypothetical protein
LRKPLAAIELDGERLGIRNESPDTRVQASDGFVHPRSWSKPRGELLLDIHCCGPEVLDWCARGKLRKDIVPIAEAIRPYYLVS